MGTKNTARHFRVLLRGSNFLLDLDGHLRRLGFLVTRFVIARNAVEAGSVAVGLIRTDGELVAMVRNSADDSPMLFADEIEEMPRVSPNESLTGYTFFPVVPDEQ